MQITFDTANTDEVAVVLRLIGAQNESPSDAERLMRHLHPNKRSVLSTIAAMCEGGATPSVPEVAARLDIPHRTLISHKRNIGRTVKRLDVSHPVQTTYPDGYARYRMDERTRQAILSCSR